MTPRRFLPALLLLFVGSGCAALIYEVVWFQLLQLVIGSSAVSMAVLLGTFMGGMCLGSYLLPRYIGAREHPLRVYAFLELGIGICGLVGSLLAGFYLLRVYDLRVATFAAIALNVTVALIAFAIAKATPRAERLASDREDAAAAGPVPAAWAVYVAIALSGATALSS